MNVLLPLFLALTVFNIVYGQDSRKELKKSLRDLFENITPEELMKILPSIQAQIVPSDAQAPVQIQFIREKQGKPNDKSKSEENGKSENKQNSKIESEQDSRREGEQNEESTDGQNMTSQGEQNGESEQRKLRPELMRQDNIRSERPC
ncbi:unnamed protein product [Brachionus calyciflorus]|uniref:Uncharacterized protein n=1 Tax=Brachionus calyciflorus TaxID=104777 RepID=A0A813Y8V6_9BILA|nr:unnamed protein product [Brachionus calyciflorus]